MSIGGQLYSFFRIMASTRIKRGHGSTSLSSHSLNFAANLDRLSTEFFFLLPFQVGSLVFGAFLMSEDMGVVKFNTIYSNVSVDVRSLKL